MFSFLAIVLWLIGGISQAVKKVFTCVGPIPELIMPERKMQNIIFYSEESQTKAEIFTKSIARFLYIPANQSIILVYLFFLYTYTNSLSAEF